MNFSRKNITMKSNSSILVSMIIGPLTVMVLILGQSACFTEKQSIPTTIISNSTSMDKEAVANNSSAAEKEIAPSILNMEEPNVVITFASYEFDRVLYEPLMDIFHQENPSITVHFVPLSENSQVNGDYYRAMASSADTTLIIGRSADFSAYFQDLKPQIDSDTSFKPDDFWPGALTACQDAQGRVFGIPLTIFFTGIFYDEAAFTEIGLPVPTAGWTWNDFRQATTALTKQDGTVTRYGFADPSYSSVLQPFIDASLEKINGEIDVDGLSQILQWYVDLAKSGELYPIQGSAGGEDGMQADARWSKMFQSNEAPAMWFGRLQESVPGLAGVSEETDPATHLAITKYGIAPFPISPEDSNINTTPLSAQCASISTGSLHPQADWAWINFLSQHWLISDRTQVSELVIIPSRQSVAEKEGFWNTLPDRAKPAVRFGLNHAYYPGLYISTKNKIYEALEEATSGKGTLESSLTGAREKMILDDKFIP